MFRTVPVDSVAAKVVNVPVPIVPVVEVVISGPVYALVDEKMLDSLPVA